MVLFLKVFLTEFIAEMGDKTQLMLIALTSKYKLKDIILGTAAVSYTHLTLPTRKRKKAANPKFGSHRSPFSVRSS